MLIKNATVYMFGSFLSDMFVRLSNGKISEVSDSLSILPGEDAVDLQGDYLVPGFVDVHIHAYQGSDTMHGEEAIRSMCRGLRKLGVAAICPTTMSASVADTQKAIDAVRMVMNSPEPHGSLVLGAHMEAPFLQSSAAGAQMKDFFLNPDWNVFLQMTSGHTEAVRIITLAPELEGSEDFIRRAAAVGIHVSIGHTAASAETVHRAMDLGADHITHTFNAQTPLHHRLPGVPGAALVEDRCFCEMICDGVHLHRDIIKLITRCKGRKAIAVTDAMEAAGLPEGEYTLGGQKVLVRGNEARLTNGTLAGSVLTMPQAMENLIHVFNVDPAAACAMCTSSPADSVGNELCGRIAPGAPLPLTRWTRDWLFAQVIDV